MLLDRSLFDLSGRSCDKVGVSYSAFRRKLIESKTAFSWQIPSGGLRPTSGQLSARPVGRLLCGGAADRPSCLRPFIMS